MRIRRYDSHARIELVIAVSVTVLFATVVCSNLIKRHAVENNEFNSTNSVFIENESDLEFNVSPTSAPKIAEQNLLRPSSTVSQL